MKRVLTSRIQAAESLGPHLETAPGTRNIDWLARMLQAAVEIEFYTIPPYLTALWSIKDETSPVAASIREVVQEEMAHMAIACNLLSGLGFTPKITDAVPKYPGRLPFGVKGDQEITLRRCDQKAVGVFVELERPDDPHDKNNKELSRTAKDYPSIGRFYSEIRATFMVLRPTLDARAQIHGHLSPLVMTRHEEAIEALTLIIEQGEGSSKKPYDDSPEDLSHYWRFREMQEGWTYEFDPYTEEWDFTRKPFLLPDTYPMAEVPARGYDPNKYPAAAPLLAQFDEAFSRMLTHLQDAWTDGGQGSFWQALEAMFTMRKSARALMEIELPGKGETFGPSFRYSSSLP